ncbi:hypothetical protein M0R04_13990 [Candidatus Dojkabacteria bacterium]|jgi:hypothetical protein|nr:hypothetical protein [Candidatus Dojkabacteria bacterium]
MNKNYNKERYDFIRLAIKHRLSYSQIGKLLNISKARVHQILKQNNYKEDLCLVCRTDTPKKLCESCQNRLKILSKLAK